MATGASALDRLIGSFVPGPKRAVSKLEKECQGLREELEERQGFIDRMTEAYASIYRGGGVPLLKGHLDEQLLLGVSTVYACVGLLARTMASLPIRLYRRIDEKSREMILEDPRLRLLAVSPNEEMSAYDFRSAVQANYSLFGNGYGNIVRGREGEVLELWPIRARDVTIDRNLQTVQRELTYRVNGIEESFGADLMLHLRGLGFNGLQGCNFDHYVSGPVALARAIDDNAYKFFTKGNFSSGFLKHPGNLDKDKYLPLQKKINEGIKNAGEFAWWLVDSGITPFPLRQPNRDSQMEELRTEQDLAIARYFGVPPTKLGIPVAQPRANVEQENLAFATDTIRPLSILWAQCLNTRLLEKEEQGELFFELDLNSLLQGDTEARVNYYREGRAGGWFGVNDIRMMEGFNPLPDDLGDRHLEPLNMRAVEDIGQEEPEINTEGASDE